MSIKSDRWITRMATEHGMIEPFQAGQVRTDANGEKLISYGVSSYGYDVRCADEFKVFTNIHSATVDPKHFDERKASSTSKGTTAPFRPIPSPWPAPWSTSAFRAAC